MSQPHLKFNPNQFKNPNLLVIAGAVLVGILLLSESFVVVNPGQRGIRVTLGAVSHNLLPEGPNLKLPFIQKIQVQSIKQQSQPGTTSAFSSDLQTMQVEYQVLYRLPEKKLVELYQKYQGDPYQNLILPRIEETVKQVSAEYRAEDFVKKREAAKVRVLAELKNSLHGLINIDDFPIKNIDLSDDLEHAIEQKQIKEQEALAKKYELDKARRQAEITIVDAEAEAKAVRIKGDAIKASPEVINLEIAKKWDGKSPTTVVVGKGGSNVLLPLR
ncbi:MAG: prohibitin family protein [Cyanobacteria bacterium HKST-UBA06]|nr:prohibitin family protein [Cyanobacteria bacterium HKST-UBA04]MCA9806421.1 prohibitin family protein [Cyanobacteria bacterium HKST-UBA06]